MKKETMEQTTNNIILDDKEMEVLIRQLVKKAHEKGACMSKLNQAITIIWKDECKDEKKKLTKEEEIFAKKVEKFLQYYGDAIIKMHNKENNGKNIIKEDNVIEKKQFLQIYYDIIISIYAVYLREDRVNQHKIVCFARKNLKVKSCWIGEEVELLHAFFFKKLYFSDDISLPTYSENAIVDKEHSILKNLSFLSFFLLKDKYTSILIHEVALATVWFIEKYF